MMFSFLFQGSVIVQHDYEVIMILSVEDTCIIIFANGFPFTVANSPKDLIFTGLPGLVSPKTYQPKKKIALAHF